MRKFLKRVVATVATLAMVVAGLVVAPKSVKAAGDTTKLVVYLSGIDNVGKVYLDTQSNQGPTANITSTATKSDLLDWGRQEYEFTKVADGKYEIELTGTCDTETWINFQIVVVSEDNTMLFGGKFSLSNYADAAEKLEQALAFNENDAFYFSIDENTAAWQEIGYSLTDPNAQPSGGGDSDAGDVSVMPIVLLALAAAATVVVVSKKRVHA